MIPTFVATGFTDEHAHSIVQYGIDTHDAKFLRIIPHGKQIKTFFSSLFQE